jgi:hypothetical protein
MIAVTGFALFATKAPSSRYDCPSLLPATLHGSLTMMAVTGFALFATNATELPTTVHPFDSQP